MTNTDKKVRISSEQYKLLKVKAFHEGRTITEIVEEFIEKGLKGIINEKG